VFFAYSVSLGRRTAQLRQEVERLKQQLHKG